MKGPLPGWVLAYVGGILLGQLWQPPLPWLFGGAFGLIVIASLADRWQAWWLWPLLILTGWTNLTCQTALLDPNDLRQSAPTGREICTLRGRLAETPSARFNPNNPKSPWHTLVQLDALALSRKEDWQPVSGRVMVSTPGQLDEGYYQGRLVEITGVLQKPSGPLAEGLFDYRKFLYWQGIYYQLHAASSSDWQLINEGAANPSPPWSDRFCQWARACLARGLPEEDESLRLIWAMTLGWKTALNGEVAEPFMRTGTMHIFAISGLHITLITGIFVSLFRVLRVPRAICGGLLIPLIWCYTAVTGWQASAIRSAAMMSVIIAGWALHRPSNLVNSLAGAGFLLLLWDPRQLFQTGFQLSFLVVLSLALLLPLFEQWLEQRLEPDELLPEELRPLWQRRLDQPVRLVMTNLMISLAAWLGSLPLIAYYFHLVTPVSLIANLLVVPLSSLALACNLGSLVCGDWLSYITVLFNHSGWFWMRLMVIVSQALANLPGGYYYVQAPGPLTFIVYYFFLALVLTRKAWSIQTWMWAWRLWLVLGLGWLWQLVSDSRISRLTVLALPSGEALYFDAPGTRADLMIDPGDSRSATSLIEPFLRAQGVNRLERCLITHGDARHIGGLTNLVAEFRVRHVISNPGRYRSAVYKGAIKELAIRQAGLEFVQQGDAVGAWRILHPGAAGQFSEADDSATVMLAELNHCKVLFCSDLSPRGQHSLMAGHEDLTSNIVVAGMPSKGEPLDEALLDLIRPELVVITGRRPTASLRQSMAQRYENRGLRVIYTAESGTVTLTFTPHGWFLKTWGEGEADYSR
jgi:competence protein ComEC